MWKNAKRQTVPASVRRVVWIGCRALGPLRSTSTGHRLPPFTLGSGALRRLDRLPGSLGPLRSTSTGHRLPPFTLGSGALRRLDRLPGSQAHFGVRPLVIACLLSHSGLARCVVWIGCRALGPLRSTSTGHRLPPFTLGSGALRRLDRLPGSLGPLRSTSTGHRLPPFTLGSGALRRLDRLPGSLGPLRSTSTGHRLPPFTLGSGALRRLDRLPGSRPTSEYVHWSSPASFHTRVWRVASSGSVGGLSRPTSEYVHWSSPASFHTRVWRVASSGSVAGLSRPTSEYVHWSSPASFRPPSCRETSVQVGRHVCPVGTTSVCTGEEKRNDRAPGALLSRLQVSPNPQPVSNHRYPPDQVK